MPGQKPTLDYSHSQIQASKLRPWQILLITLAIIGLIFLIVLIAFWYFVLRVLWQPGGSGGFGIPM
jgi:heme/copper-type cytochrome/quinol oxidase subunit 2